MTDMPDTPTETSKIQPWMIAAAVGIGAGVIIGMKVASSFKPAPLPIQRVNCPNCEQRAREAAAAAEERARQLAQATVVGPAAKTFSPYSAPPADPEPSVADAFAEFLEGQPDE